jgi:hypothetical protein
MEEARVRYSGARSMPLCGVKYLEDEFLTVLKGEGVRVREERQRSELLRGFSLALLNAFVR